MTLDLSSDTNTLHLTLHLAPGAGHHPPRAAAGAGCGEEGAAGEDPNLPLAAAPDVIMVKMVKIMVKDFGEKVQSSTRGEWSSGAPWCTGAAPW